ncbi:MAG: hypothetical protein ABSD75_34450 [Terriglobales bacterium]|jgi:hypothetical protein
MENWFGVDHPDVERLLGEWRWLCSKPMALIARNAFADLFLRDESGEIYCLDVAVGKLARVADSEVQFRELAAMPEKRSEWFAELEEHASAARGLNPNATQCIGFSVPLVFAQCGSPSNTPYIADLHEHVSFLGDLHRQISEVPDEGKVRLVVAPKP